MKKVQRRRVLVHIKQVRKVMSRQNENARDAELHVHIYGLI